jgi:hypothetical protein
MPKAKYDRHVPKAGLAGLRFVAAGIALFLATFSALDPALAAVASPHSASSIPIDFLQDASTPILEPRAAISVMIVGDSITQGREGDWTWRYRLWQWFQEQGVAVCNSSCVHEFHQIVRPSSLLIKQC